MLYKGSKMLPLPHIFAQLLPIAHLTYPLIEVRLEESDWRGKVPDVASRANLRKSLSTSEPIR